MNLATTIKLHAGSEAEEPPVGAYSRKHFNKKEDFFQPKPGDKGGTIQATIVKRGSQHCVVSEKGKNLGCSPSAGGAKKRLAQVEYFKHRDMKGFGDPTAGNNTYGVIEPISTYHPPSLKKPQRVPADDPREKNNRFGDVDKRKAAMKQRLELLKHSSPGGLPPQIPVGTTAQHHPMDIHQIAGAARRVKIIQRPAKMDHGVKRTFIPYNRRGSA